MSAAFLSVFLLGAAALIPPLTDAQTGRLETARDGQDHREEAFVALVENARSFRGSGPGIAGSAPVRLEPDLAALLADPASHRGALCRITGVLQQVTPLARPHDDATEWFVRDDEGRPILVYLVGLEPEERETFRPGRPVAVYARFYKPVDADARDGTSRRYAAFVGARPWIVAAAERGGGMPGVFAILVVAVIGLGAVFVLLMVATRRQRRARPRGVGIGGRHDVDEPDDAGPLPEDPVDALVELKRRAGDA